MCEKNKESRKVKTLYTIGAGGFEREAAWLVERINSNKENSPYSMTVRQRRRAG